MATDERDEETDDEAVLARDFYRCPNTGELVYRWAHARYTLAGTGTTSGRDE